VNAEDERPRRSPAVGSGSGLTGVTPTWLAAMGCIATARVEALGRAMAATTGPLARGARASLWA
jgi:hypothetical protein